MSVSETGEPDSNRNVPLLKGFHRFYGSSTTTSCNHKNILHTIFKTFRIRTHPASSATTGTGFKTFRIRTHPATTGTDRPRYAHHGGCAQQTVARSRCAA
jgi:hypothetical protein